MRKVKGSLGFDAATKSVGLVEPGIVDADKAMRIARGNALSAAGTMLRT